MKVAADSRPATWVARTVKYHELSEADLKRWFVWQTRPDFSSPYFHPAFTECVDQVRNDVQVALIQDGGDLVGILPYQAADARTSEPVGGAINDYHGILLRDPMSRLQADMIRACGINRFRFHSWINADSSIDDFRYGSCETTLADFSDGPDDFLQELRDKSYTINRHDQKMRKMIRELGPLRLELDCRDTACLDWVIQLKREKYKQSKIVDFFGVPWTRQLLHQIHQCQRSDFGGVLSVLYAGQHRVAAHFGMRCRSTLHYWFPVYDRKFRKYSPGTELFLEIVRQSSQLGFRKIDFGYGDEAYKTRLTNRQRSVIRGCVDFNPVRRVLGRAFDQVVTRVKHSPAKQPIKRAVRRFIPSAGQPRV